MLLSIIISILVAFFICLLISPFWISFIKKKSFGQPIRDDGPERHLAKWGTPTLGGVIVFISVILSLLILGFIRGYLGWEVLLILIAAVACGLIGFSDDFIKVRRARSLGLKARYKILLLFILSLIIGYLATRYVGLSTLVNIPGTKIYINLSYGYYLFIFIIILASTTAINFTDGLDGLAAGVVITILAAYLGISLLRGQVALAILAAIFIGACLGFLWFNFVPASIFMGDTGALALGGAIGTFSILTKTELLLILLAMIPVIETLSVIIQVISFKKYKKRVFKMTPLHHHFELTGWAESKIVFRFWISSAFFALAGFLVFYFTH